MYKLLTKVESKNLSKNTYLTYKNTLDIFYSKYKKINFENIYQFLTIDNKEMKPSTLHLRKIILMKELELCRKKDVISTAEIKLPPIVEEYKDVLTIEEIKYISSFSHNTNQKLEYRNKNIILTLYFLGLRCNEICNVKIRDINHKDQTIVINGKGKKKRVLFIHKQLLPYIKIVTNQTYLFENFKNKKLTPRTINKIVSDIVVKSKINKKITPHSLRRSFCTNLIKNGANIKIVSMLMGHSKIETTARYLHFTKEEIYKEYMSHI